ncbi:ABC-2 type transport system permease protein [Halobacillus alkaliphilus]|uniref:ABC-2 type transport system permease protein n=1 Tax=Halobacillus alkaliphilus TaxID=396056 RepID=A0A1I2KIK8_9BACI|nr:ABC transporter permease [Halobacillus alkaliphilus]SFF64786.1 ABC-2 type transport system permease protein [Halobacillus alkaliphilus]
MISIKRIQAVVIKDYRDLLKNAYMLSTAVIPLFFAFIFSQGEGMETAVVFMPITLSMVMVGSFIQAGVIAEEKEKNTLRGLLLSPLNTSEIFIGKSVLSAVLSIIMVVAVILIGNIPMPDQTLLVTAAILISLVIFISIGTILGLVSRTVMETSVAGIPVLFIFGMGDVFRTMIESEWLIKVLSYLPDKQLGQLLQQLMNGQSVGEHFLVLALWAVLSVIVTIYIFKKRRFD